MAAVLVGVDLGAVAATEGVDPEVAAATAGVVLGVAAAAPCSGAAGAAASRVMPLQAPPTATAT